jgi:hypothetical protein
VKIRRPQKPIRWKRPPKALREALHDAMPPVPVREPVPEYRPITGWKIKIRLPRINRAKRRNPGRPAPLEPMTHILVSLTMRERDHLRRLRKELHIPITVLVRMAIQRLVRVTDGPRGRVDPYGRLRGKKSRTIQKAFATELGMKDRRPVPRQVPYDPQPEQELVNRLAGLTARGEPMPPPPPTPTAKPVVFIVPEKKT